MGSWEKTSFISSPITSVTHISGKAAPDPSSPILRLSTMLDVGNLVRVSSKLYEWWMTGALRQGGPRLRLGRDGWCVGVVAGVRRGVGVGVVAARLGTPGRRAVVILEEIENDSLS